MKRTLTRDEKLRTNRVAFTGALLAAVMCLMVMGLLDSGSPIKIFTSMGAAFALPAALATFVSIRLCWGSMLCKTETRGRGARYGALSGLLALLLTAIFMMTGMSVLSLFDAVTGGHIDLVSVLWVPVYTFVLFLYMFVLGGFLAIPVGALAGFMLTKDPQP